jgi:hypothetical protein
VGQHLERQRVCGEAARTRRPGRSRTGAGPDLRHPGALDRPKGDPGTTGEPGIKGEPGQAATALWAVVSGGSGGLVRSSGATSSHKRNTGEFEVFFDRDVSPCSYQVTMAATPGDAVAEPKTANADGVFVESFESGGKLADKTFYLAVFC